MPALTTTSRAAALLMLAMPAVSLHAQQVPVAPAVIIRDTAGHATVRAIRLTAPLVLDGQLDEDLYKREQPFGGLLQVAPHYGQAASERTDLWVSYDDRHIYVSCRCWDSAPPGEWIANELRRDTGGLRNNDHIGVMFDTFFDRRSGFGFYTNPLGARADYSVVDEGSSNSDWNPVWTSSVGRFDGGWTVEMAIPLKSLRYRPGANQTWGLQVRRSIRRKNEWAYLTRVPQVLAGPMALNRVSAGGTLVGLDLPPVGRNVEIKPYALAGVTTDRVRTPATEAAGTVEAGGDLKYHITPNLTLDLTANTDFAQVEIDEQQVNLTRFSLFFPEKREFFLEGRGIFDFGRGGVGFSMGDNGDTPYLFYSRRIGLDAGRVVPIQGGGRLTGKVGPWALGMMSVRTGSEPVAGTRSADFGVIRIKRDVFRRGAIGMIATNRSVAATGTGANQAYGVDGAFGLTQNMSLGGYLARTSTTGLQGEDHSWQTRVDYSADRYGAKAELLEIGANFRPDVGFLRRNDLRRGFAELRFSPRPTRLTTVRKFSWVASGEHIESTAGELDTRQIRGAFSTEFQNSDQFSLEANSTYERLSAPFTLAGSPAPIPAGGYSFNDVGASYTFGAHRRVAGVVSVRAGDYYDGSIRSVSVGGSGFSPGRVTFTRHLSIEPGFSLVRIDRPGGSFTTRLGRTRVDYAFTPLMFASALVQYNSADRSLSTNVRYRWEYAPGSDLFVVYTDERGTADPLSARALPRGLRNRAIVVKATRLLRY